MNLCDRNDIQSLLARHGFRFAKSLGQNFLIEGWVAEDIAAAGCPEGCGVLEVGPGIGALTVQLARRAEKVVSVELDRRLPPVLAETMAAFPNFTLVEGDIMQQELPTLVRQHFTGLRPVLCANLPYNITTPFLTACVEAGCFDSLTVLIQKEVAQRICAAPGTADYGAFSVLMQYYTQPELLFTVPNTCFLPPPKVTSAVVRCITRKTPPVQVRSVDDFWRTVRSGFALRRKTLVNSLQTGWQLPKEQLTAIVAACGLGENHITPADLLGLTGTDAYAMWNDCWLDFMDFLSEGFAMPLGAMLMALMVGWEKKPKTMLDEIEIGSGKSRAFRLFYTFCIKILVPIAMCFILAGQLIDFFTPYSGAYSVRTICYAFSAALLVIFFIVAVIPQKKTAQVQ